MNVFLCYGASVRYNSVPVLRALLKGIGVEMTEKQFKDALYWDNWGQPDWPGGCRCSYCIEHPNDSYYKQPVTRGKQIEGI